MKKRGRWLQLVCGDREYYYSEIGTKVAETESRYCIGIEGIGTRPSCTMVLVSSNVVWRTHCTYPLCRCSRSSMTRFLQCMLIAAWNPDTKQVNPAIVLSNLNHCFLPTSQVFLVMDLVVMTVLRCCKAVLRSLTKVLLCVSYRDSVFVIQCYVYSIFRFTGN